MNSVSFQKATAALKAAHLQDPNKEFEGPVLVPAEWLYTQQLLDCLQQVYPDASEALTIAAYCQHLYRWKIKRTEYPEGRIGYYQWRNYLLKSWFPILYTTQISAVSNLLCHPDPSADGKGLLGIALLQGFLLTYQ